MLFLLAEYYIEGEGVMNKVTVMIRAKLNGKYPYLTAVVVVSPLGDRLTLWRSGVPTGLPSFSIT
jgi:hypothetical protein